MTAAPSPSTVDISTKADIKFAKCDAPGSEPVPMHYLMGFAKLARILLWLRGLIDTIG